MEKGNGTKAIEDAREYLSNAIKGLEVKTDMDRVAMGDLQVALHALSFYRDWEATPDSHPFLDIKHIKGFSFKSNAD